MTLSVRWLVRTAVIVSMVVGPGTIAPRAADDGDLVVASGTLDGRFLDSALFHIGEFWMRVPPDTEFNRWLSQGLGRTVVIRLLTDPARFDDVKNVRILTGILMHQTAPKPTPATTDVVGRLPEGGSGFVHVLFLKDELTGTLGAVTFETADVATAAKFDIYNGLRINIVIQLE